MANACQGLPSGPCPDSRQDKSVKFGIYDLFLCPSCEKARDEGRADKKGKLSKKTGKNAVSGQPTTSTVASVCDVTAVNVDCAVGPTIDGSSSNSNEIVINELLSYVGFYRNSANIDALRRTVLTFYSPTAVSQAKRILVGKFQSKLATCPLLSERRSTTARSAQEAEVDDVIGIFDTLDAQGALENVMFAAVKLDNLPKFGPEEINVASVVERQARVESTMNDIKVTVQALSLAQEAATVDAAASSSSNYVQSAMTELHRRFDEFSSSVNARLDQLNTACRASLGAHSIHEPENIVDRSTNADRQLNIVLFGVPENRDASVWRHSVDDILRYLIGNPVDISDLFRLGRFNASSHKPRPILIKLRAVWDKRLILSRRSKLKDYSQRGIFVDSDEPVEVRRKQTFDRLKYKAERDGKRVYVNDGVLYIDDIQVFSVRDGFLNHDRHG